MATYIVGDIHGCFREWIRFKSKIEKQDGTAEFVLVGDILDKGPNSYEMLKWAMERIQTGSKYQMVIGNHETEKLEWLRQVLKNPERKEWKNPEISRKMLSRDGYEFFRICCEKNLDFRKLTEIKNWLESLPFYIEKEVTGLQKKKKVIITHHRLLSERREKCIQNISQKDEQELTIIHGHLPTTLEPCKSEGAVSGKIWIQDKDINVDCGLVYGVSKAKGLFGDLAALRLEDFKEFYYYDHKI